MGLNVRATDSTSALCLHSSLLLLYQDLFAEAVNFPSKIDFSASKTSDTVRYVYHIQHVCFLNLLLSVFETTIRYLGSLLSAYELSCNKFPALLQKAEQVADKMAFAWVGVHSAESFDRNK